MRNFMRLGLLVLVVILILSASPAAASPEQQSGCRYFAETEYNVCDDANGRFLTAFNRWGLQAIGYPVSRRYQKDGFTMQAFQKAIMQWRPEAQDVVLANIFDDLHNAGFDQRLLETRQTPLQLPAGWDGEGLNFPEIVARRQALLDARPALRQAYFTAGGDPLIFFGLPTSEVTDMGNHYAIRLQRAVLQEWKEAVPWAQAGQVTIANGGDIAKELGALPAEALRPDSGPTTPPPAPNPPAPNPPVPNPPAPPPSNGCEPSYPDVCIPLRSQVGDLDCPQIPHRNFRVIGSDPHGFDGDNDGVGCET